MALSEQRKEAAEEGFNAAKRIKKLTGEKARQAAPDSTTALSLCGMHIESLQDLEGFGSLRRLVLSGNGLMRLPYQAMAGVPHLTFLQADHNSLTGEGLDGLRALPELKVLNCAHNKIKSLVPGVFAEIKGLQALVLNNNELTSLPPSLWKTGLRTLNTLVVSNNKIKSISGSEAGGSSSCSGRGSGTAGGDGDPKRRRQGRGGTNGAGSKGGGGLGRLKALKKLSASHNALEVVPDLEGCTELEELRLAHNRITHIPPSFASHASLRILDLGHNLIGGGEGAEPSEKGTAAPPAPAAAAAVEGVWAELGALASLPALVQLSLAGNPMAMQAKGERAAKTAAATGGTELYAERMKWLFPLLKVRDGQRVLLKMSHKPSNRGGGGSDGVGAAGVKDRMKWDAAVSNGAAPATAAEGQHGGPVIAAEGESATTEKRHRDSNEDAEAAPAAAPQRGGDKAGQEEGDAPTAAKKPEKGARTAFAAMPGGSSSADMSGGNGDAEVAAAAAAAAAGTAKEAKRERKRRKREGAEIRAQEDGAVAEKRDAPAKGEAASALTKEGPSDVAVKRAKKRSRRAPGGDDAGGSGHTHDGGDGSGGGGGNDGAASSGDELPAPVPASRAAAAAVAQDFKVVTVKRRGKGAREGAAGDGGEGGFSVEKLLKARADVGIGMGGTGGSAWD